jgi:hypothetical protein
LMLRRPVGAVCRHCGLSLPEAPPRVLWSVQVCRHGRIRILASERGSSLKHRSLRGEILRRRATHCAVGYHSSSSPSMQSTAIVILSKNPSHGGLISPSWPHEESWRLLARIRLPMPTSPLSSFRAFSPCRDRIPFPHHPLRRTQRDQLRQMAARQHKPYQRLVHALLQGQ